MATNAKWISSLTCCCNQQRSNGPVRCSLDGFHLVEFSVQCTVNYIRYGEEQSSSLIKGIPFGVLASGASITKILHLGTSGAAGDRVIDISVQSRSTASRPLASDSASPQSPHPTHTDTGETLQTLVVSTTEPITFASQVAYKRSPNPQAGLAHLATYEDDFWDDGDGGEAHVVTTVSCVGPTGIIIESAKLIRQVRWGRKTLSI